MGVIANCSQRASQNCMLKDDRFFMLGTTAHIEQNKIFTSNKRATWWLSQSKGQCQNSTLSNNYDFSI